MFDVGQIWEAEARIRHDGAIRAQYARGSRLSVLDGVGSDFQPARHEVHQSVPGFEGDVAQQGAQIVEERLAGGQLGPDQSVSIIAVGQERVREQGQHVHSR